MRRSCSIGMMVMAALAGGGLLAGALPPSFAEAGDPRATPVALPPLPASTRGPVRLLFRPDGVRLWVAEADTGTVSVIDPKAGKILGRFPTGGEQPGALAAAPDGGLLVANTFSGSVALLDGETGRRRDFAMLRGEPSGLAVSRDGKLAFVSLGQLDELAVLELPALRLRTRVKVGRRPRAVVLTPDGRTLLVANLQGGDVSLIDTATLRETRRIAVNGINLRGLAVSADGRQAYVTGQIPANSRAAAEPLDIWINTLFALNLDPKAVAGSAEGWLDFTGLPAPDPDGVAVLGPEQIAVTLGGSDEVLRVRVRGPFTRTYDPVIEARAPVGPRPRGLTLSPDGREVWVANELGSSLSVLDAATFRPLRHVSLGIPPGRGDLRLVGRYLFGANRLTRGGQFTCNSCHPDGGSDGLTWQFVHVKDGVPRRNTRALRGGITLTAPFRWSGHDGDIEQFFQEEITGLLGGPVQPHQPLHELWNLVDQFPLPPNPYRAPDGTLTPAAKRGEALFVGKASCGRCHGGELYGGIGKKAWVGTTPEGQALDVPHLHGAYDSAPYLHDGSAATLEEVFTRYNDEQRHGDAQRLSASELADLLRYVREL